MKSFYSAVNATPQLINKPTRVTQYSKSLLFVIPVSNSPGLVQSGGALELTTHDISNHFLGHALLNIKVPKKAANYIVTSSKFSKISKWPLSLVIDDIAHIPTDLPGDVSNVELL